MRKTHAGTLSTIAINTFEISVRCRAGMIYSASSKAIRFAKIGSLFAPHAAQRPDDCLISFQV